MLVLLALHVIEAIEGGTIGRLAAITIVGEIVFFLLRRNERQDNRPVGTAVIKELYLPLDGIIKQIRLLSILPAAHFTDQVSCTLTIVPIHQCAEYEALSYCWGDPNITEPIIVSGHTLNLTTNLASAIRHLRRTDQPRLMWIDAVCINQADTNERNHQVRQMRQIYQGANEVIVWLGSDDSLGLCAKEIMAFIRTMGKDKSLHWRLSGPSTVDGEALNIHELESLVLLLRSPWWYRVWTVQESLLAKKLTFVCGHEKCLEEDLFALSRSYSAHFDKDCCMADYLNQFAELIGKLGKLFIEINNLENFRNNASSISLGSMLCSFRQRRATDPRDKVYGFLGLTTQISEISENLIDYNKSLATAFKEVTMNVILTTGLEVLSQVIVTDSRTITEDRYGPTGSVILPSWCPDWNLPLDDFTMVMLSKRTSLCHVFQASGDTKSSGSLLLPDVETLPTTFPSISLVLRGLAVDTIEEVGENNLNWMNWTSNNKGSFVYQWLQLMWANQPSNGNYLTGQSWIDAFLHTICGSMSGENFTKHTSLLVDSHDSSLFEAWFMDYAFGFGEEERKSRSETGQCSTRSKISGEITGHVMVNSMNRRFFICTGGLMGLAPAGAEKGDTVCILLGSGVPYVVRRVTTVNYAHSGAPLSCYQFLGDAYVHGIMNGEAVKDLEENDKRLEDFAFV
jgi:hypothetical protein